MVRNPFSIVLVLQPVARRVMGRVVEEMCVSPARGDPCASFSDLVPPATTHGHATHKTLASGHVSVKNSSAKYTMDEKDTWKIEIQLRNDHHKVLHTVKHTGRYGYDDVIRKELDPHFLPEIDRLKWPGFGLWCYHVPIKEDTTFASVNFLREADKTVVFQCEDHNCQYRQMKISHAKYDECVVCMENKPTERLMSMCGHKCMCEGCYKNAKFCPMCRFPFNQKK